MINIMMFTFLFTFTLLIYTKKYSGYPLLLIPAYYLLIDYANYSLNLSDGVLGLIAKSYNELLLISTALLVLSSTINRRGAPKKATIFIGISLLFLLGGIIKNDPTTAILDWRSSVAPIVIAWLAAEAKLLKTATLANILGMTAWLIALNSIYAVFQSYTFSGNIEEYWRYTFLLEEKLKANPEYETRFIYYQLLRDDELRSSGLFVSALQYSYSAAFASFYFIVKIFGAVKSRQTGLLTLYIAGAAICIAGVLASQVRASLITLIISLATYFACYHPRGKEKFKHRRALLLLSASVLIYALALLLFGTKFDSSVQGRIVQYTYGLQNFKITGFWPGSFKGQFDSYYLYASMTFGAALFFWIYFILTSYSSIYKKINSANLSPKENFNTVIAFCTIPAAMVLACFQHLAGSLYYQIVWLLLFALLKTTKAQACPDSQPYNAATR